MLAETYPNCYRSPVWARSACSEGAAARDCDVRVQTDGEADVQGGEDLGPNVRNERNVNILID